MQGSGFRVQDLGFRVQDLGCRVQDLGFRVEGDCERLAREREPGGPPAPTVSVSNPNLEFTLTSSTPITKVWVPNLLLLVAPWVSSVWLESASPASCSNRHRLGCY